MGFHSKLKCVSCGTEYGLDDDRIGCDCGGLLDVEHNLADLADMQNGLKIWFDVRREALDLIGSGGVWRFHELVMPDIPRDRMVSRGEGNTRLYLFPKTRKWLNGIDILFKHEGENPTGSFKDRGMTVAVSWAKFRGSRYVVCASTGNTAASVASYASLAGIPAVILIPENSTALGKVAQSMAYGAKTLKVRGDFDAAMRLVLESRQRLGLTVLNSVNPFRLEGQKTIVLEILQQLGWKEPDWIVVPGGNLGNTSAFGKALVEAQTLGLIRRLPRLAVIQAAGAAPFADGSVNGWAKKTVTAETIATAIRIGNPVNWDKARRAVENTNGVVTTVTDQEIMDAKAVIDSDGVGAEPASCATAAGVRRLLDEGVIGSNQSVVAVLTGNMLKDPTATIGYHSGRLDGFDFPHANAPQVIEPTFDDLARALGRG